MMRLLAHLFSIVLHPLLVPVYLLVILMRANPGTFRFIDSDPGILLITVLVNMVVLPLVAILIMKGLGFIQSLRMEGRQERIAPFIAGLFFYIWSVTVFVKQGVPSLFTAVIAGMLAALILSFLVNVLFFKISLHMVGMGVAFAYLLALVPVAELDVLPFFLMAVLAGGITGSSRLYLGAHTSDEVYMGFLIGMAGQMIALYIVV